jgi:1-acyl-sn-glycerol-3-phosphate acyltransferase
VRWAGCEPDIRQRIYFANHTSHFDFLVVWGSLPTDVRAITRPVAAKDYWNAGPVRRYLAARVFRAVLIDRVQVTRSNNPLADALEAMGDRSSLILFPEGTRGSGEEVQPFRSGLYHLARRRPDAELVPAYIENLNRVLPKGEFFPIPLLTTVTFGAPVRIAEQELRDPFLARAREALSQLADL